MTEKSLSVRQALAWTCLLFMMPVMVLVGLVAFRAWSDIQGALREGRGLDYLTQIWPAMTETDRDLGARQPAFDLEFGTSDAAAAFIRSTAVDARFKAGAQLIGDVADGSGLTLDPELADDHLIEAITARLPALVNAATEVNEVAQIRDADQAGRMAVALDRLQAASDQARGALEAAMKYDAAGVTHSVLHPHVTGLAAANRDLMARAQAALAGGDPAAVSAARSELQRRIDGAWRASQGELNRLLAARILSLAQRLAAELTLVLALLVMAGAISAKIATGLRRRLSDVAEVGEKLVANQVYIDVPHVGAGGEVGRIALALSGLKSDLIERNLNRYEADDRHRAAEARLEAAQAAIAVAQTERRAAIGALGAALKRVGQGDLTATIEDELAADFQGLKSEFNAATAILRDALLGVADEAVAMQRDVEALARSADDLSRRTGEQVAGLESAASSLNGLTDAARDAFNEARRVGAVVGVTKDEAEQGDLIVRQAAKSMEQIATLAQQINQVVGVMDEIAFQTNILAINAGVEAARSGESGRGFAIVAQEVRALAQRSASAAKDIRALITASTREVGSGVNLVGQTSQALAKVLRQVAEIDGVVAALAAAAETQVGGLAETGGAVGRVEQSAQLGAAALSQSTAAAQALREGVAELAGWMAALRLSPPAPARPSLRPGAAARTRPAPVIQLNEARGGVQRRPWPPLGRGGRIEGDDR